MQEAAVHFEAAVKDRPDSVEARMNLANAYSGMPGRLKEAAEQYEFVVRARPDYAEGHYFLGLTLAKIPGRTDDAIAEFEAALRIKPDPEVQELVNEMRRARAHP
jgi:protein O-mannosyl-transferase